MAKHEDVQWLLKGPKAWNERREKDAYSWPDLSKANISSLLKDCARITKLSKLDLRSYNLSGANFSGSILSDVDLSGANCILTRFENANIRGSKFTEADLRGANFSNSRLVGTELVGTRCFKTDFSNAYLSECNFTDAHLYGAQLVGADLSNCTLWKAKLFWPANFVSDHPRADIPEGKPISSVSDLLKYVDTLGDNYISKPGSEPFHLYFRGEPKVYRNIVPSVMRKTRIGNYLLRSNEAEMLVDLITRRPDDFSSDLTALGQLMTAQHYRLPTRLLDVTRNPLVALFNAIYETESSGKSGTGQLHAFAVPQSMIKPYNSHSISVIANFTKLRRSEQNLLLTKTKEYTEKEKDSPPFAQQTQLRSSDYSSAMARLVQSVRLENPSFEERIDPHDLFRIFIVEPRRSIERIRSQSGAFLLSAFHECFDEKEVNAISKDILIYHQYTFKIPCESKGRVMKQLSNLNITEATMYPGLEKEAEAVKKQYGG